MPAIMVWYDYEDVMKRRIRTITIGSILTRVYMVPEASAETLKPSKGTLLPGDADTVTAGRVRNCWLDWNVGHGEGNISLVVEFIKPEAYA